VKSQPGLNFAKISPEGASVDAIDHIFLILADFWGTFGLKSGSVRDPKKGHFGKKAYFGRLLWNIWAYFAKVAYFDRVWGRISVYVHTPHISVYAIGVGWESRSLTRRRWTQSYGLDFMRDRLECGPFIRDFCRERSEFTKMTLIWNSVFIAFLEELGGRGVSSAVAGHHLAEPNGGFRSWASVFSDLCINIFSFWPFHTIVVKYAHFGISVQNKD